MGERPVELTDELLNRIERASDELASGGMRVLGFAVRSTNKGASTSEIEEKLTFLGLIGMIDPPRSEAREAVQRCLSAGIRPVMITGDHPLTARRIASDLDIAEESGTVLTGERMEHSGGSEFDSTVKEVSVFARVSPQDKLKIVQALQDQGQVVAMTGDGVNDAPALKKAHIGVAMGQTGTDVAKEASEMVLLDDNFATIVNAVEEGRIVHDNIRKFVKYTMTSNAGEVGVMLLSPLLGMPLALLPLQILWINLVTDGLPGLALALEPAERDTMSRPPLPLNEPIIDRRMGIDIAWIGLLMAVVSLTVGYWYWQPEGSDTSDTWRTMIFTVLTLSQMGNALAIRSNTQTLFQIGIFSNPALLGAVTLTLAMQVAVVYWTPMQRIFHTTALSAGEFALCLIFSTVVFGVIESVKYIVGLRSTAK